MPQAAPKLRIHSTSQIIIPARLASTRLPRKLLLRETGKSLIQHTYEAARRARRPAGVCVATDYAEIFDEVRRFGGQAEMTSPTAPSGTDRVAEVARRMTDVDIIVNVQGDEPEIAGAFDRPGHRTAGGEPQRRDEHAGHADPLAAAVGRPGLREGGFRRRRPGAVFQPQRDSASSPMGRRPARIHPADVLPARRPLRLSPRFSAATGLDAALAGWSKSRSSSSFASSTPAIRSWSA